MIMNSITTYPADRFSFGRLAMVARYYWPTVRMQVILYPAISLVAGILITLCKGHAGWALILTGFLSMPMSLLLNFGPLVFAIKSNQEIEAMIPARTSEKTTFVLRYNLVVMPFLILFPKFIVTYIFFPDFAMTLADTQDAQEVLRDLLADNTFFMQAISMCSTLMPVAVCTFCVFFFRKRRVLYSIIWTIVCIMVPAIAGIVFGIWFALTDIASGMDKDAFKTEFFDILRPLTISISAIGLIIDIIFCWLTARAIRRNQY